MIKTFIKILLILGLAFSCFGISNAGNIKFQEAEDAIEEFRDDSISAKSGDIKTQLKSTTLNIFKTLKIVVGGLLVFFIVYAGTMMVFSMGDDEEKISSSKRTIWYSLIGLLFINIPGTLYSAFTGKKTADTITGATGNVTGIFQRNIFINSEALGPILGNLVTFLQMILAVFAVIIIIFSGIQMMLAQGKDDVISQNKSRIIYSLLGLIFLGILEGWKNVVWKGDLLEGGQEIFASLANLALFFAGPIAIFFLSLAGYYYITAGGNEDKVKKAKSIVINTALATLILIGMYTFFADLKTLF